MISVPIIGAIASARKSPAAPDYFLPGCVLSWSFEQILSGSVIDPINAINGTINGPTISSWHKRNGALLSGSGQNLISATNPTQLNQTEISISFWIQTTTTVASIIMEKDTTSGFSLITSNLRDHGIPTGRLILATGGASSLGYSSVDINDGLPHHVVCCKGSSGFKIYIDSIDRTAGKVAGTPSYGESDFYVGSRNGLYQFNGKLDSIQLYNRFLTQSDASLLYANT